MTFTIKDYFGREVVLRPRLELYSVCDFMGEEMPGIAIILDDDQSNEQYAVLTVSFGEFISLKNSAYIDTNNCPFAPQLLKEGIAQETGFTKNSGFCSYPLWIFTEEFLKEIGAENYKIYDEAYKNYSISVPGFEMN